MSDFPPGWTVQPKRPAPDATPGSATVLVRELADFSSIPARGAGITVSGDQITIPAGVVVVAGGVVDLGSAWILLDGGTVRGRTASDGFVSTATNGVIVSNDGTVVITDLIVVAPAGPGLKLTGSKANGDIMKCIMVGVYSSPLAFDITGGSVPSITSCFVGQFPQMPAPAVGVRFSGDIGKSHVQSTPFFATTDACIVLDSAVTLETADIAGNYYQPAAGMNFLRGEVGYTLSGIAEVTRNIPQTGLPDAVDVLDGIDRFDPKWNFQSNPSIPDSSAKAAFFQGTGWETTTITTVSTPVKANLTVTSADTAERFSINPDGTLTYTGVRPRTVTVTATGSVDTAGNNQEIRFSIYKDGVLVPSSQVQVKVTTGGDQRAFATSAIVEVQRPEDHDPAVGACTLEIYVENVTSTDDVLLSNVALRAVS